LLPVLKEGVARGEALDREPVVSSAKPSLRIVLALGAVWPFRSLRQFPSANGGYRWNTSAHK